VTATVSSLPVWPADVPVHPAAELFPLMSGSDFDELVRDIKENGLVTPIVRTPDNLILDGRNRYRACEAAGIRPVYEVHAGEPWRFVISTNLHRRHLTDSQRAMVAAKIAERARGGWNHVNRSKASSEALESAPPTQDEAAQLLNVSRSQVQRARIVGSRWPEAAALHVEGVGTADTPRASRWTPSAPCAGPGVASTTRRLNPCSPVRYQRGTRRCAPDALISSEGIAGTRHRPARTIGALSRSPTLKGKGCASEAHPLQPSSGRWQPDLLWEFGCASGLNPSRGAQSADARTAGGGA